MEVFTYIILLLGGLLAGVINTLAGNGSAITLSLLIFTGQTADVANATNRIGALVQTLTAVGSLRRSSRTRVMLRESFWFILPAIMGSVLGAILAIWIDADTLRYFIGAVMLILLLTMVTNPRRWARQTEVDRERKTAGNWLAIFGIALYGGFLQMGIGIMLLAVLVLVARYSLRDGNIVKLMLALVFVVPAFVVFLFSDKIVWLPGLLLAAGQGVGAFIGARYILMMPLANRIIQWLLVAILSISSVVLLDVPRLIIELLERWALL